MNDQIIDTSEAVSTSAATDTRQAEGVKEDHEPPPPVTVPGEGVVIEEKPSTEKITFIFTTNTLYERIKKRYRRIKRLDPVKFCFPGDIADIHECMKEWSSSQESQNKVIKNVMLTYHGPYWEEEGGTIEIKEPHLKFPIQYVKTEHLEVYLNPESPYIEDIKKNVHPLTESVENIIFNTCNLGFNLKEMRLYKILFCHLFFGEGRESQYIKVYSANGYKDLISEKIWKKPVEIDEAGNEIPIINAVEAQIEKPEHLIEKYDRKGKYLINHKYYERPPGDFYIF